VPREAAGDLEGLVESALGEALGVQRHRHDQIDSGIGRTEFRAKNPASASGRDT